MAKYVFQKLIPTAVSVGILAPTIYFAYDGYIKSTTLSNFELAASRLGFNGYIKSPRLSDFESATTRLDFNGQEKVSRNISRAEHQEALLKQLQMAGYFKAEKLWQDINGLGVKDPVTTFQQIYSAVKKSKADQSDPNKFNAKILRKNLSKESGLDEQDVTDLLFYISQSAFARKVGQERNELTNQDWMNKYKEEYLIAAKTLRLIDRETPERQEYDSAWIAGASRIGVMARIIDYHYTLSKYNIKVSGETAVLAGVRGLWANIDGITPVVRERLVEAHKSKTDLDILDISLPT